MKDNDQLLRALKGYRLKSGSSRDVRKDLDLLLPLGKKESCVKLLERLGGKRFLAYKGGDAKFILPLERKPYFRIVHLNVGVPRLRFLWMLSRLATYWRGSTTIALLGVDGSGKTTICERLREVLTPFFTTRTIYFGWDQFVIPLFTVTKRLSAARSARERKDWVEREEGSKGENKGKNKGKSGGEKRDWLHLTVFYFELLARYAVRVLPRKLLGRTFILDRYFTDKLVHLDSESLKFKLFNFLTPTPDFTILITNDPASIFKRKPEKTLPEIARIQSLYVEKAEELGFTIIGNEGSLEETIRRIIAVVGPTLVERKRVIA